MRYLTLAALVLLAACVPGAEDSPLRLHEIELLDGERPFRYSYFYGAPTEITSGERRFVLSDGVIDDETEGEAAEGAAAGAASEPMFVPGALLVNGRPNRAQEMQPQPPPSQVARAGASTDMLVGAAAVTGPIVYFDGRLWFDLLPGAEAGFNTRVVPRPRLGGLRGLGQLTSAEADMLQGLLETRGPVALTVLPEPVTPAQVYGGAEIDEYRRTSLAVQTGVPVDAAAARPAVRELAWDALASGQQATVGDRPVYRLAASEDDFLTLWNQAHGALLNPPPLPEVDFRRESVVAIFLGQRPSGGYSVSAREVRIESGDVVVLIDERAPAPGDITTQALTSPWLMLRVARPNLRAVWLRDAATGNLVGAAQPLER